MTMYMTVNTLRDLQQTTHLLELLLFGLVLLSSCFASGVLQGFDIGAQIFTDSLCEDQMLHEVVYLRL